MILLNLSMVMEVKLLENKHSGQGEADFKNMNLVKLF